mgnify:CR=1 FL=1
MNGVEVGIAVDFPLATAAKMGLRFNSGKQFSLNVAVNGGETDRAVRMSKRPASRNFLRSPKMVETINDIRSQLKVSLERRVAEMSAPCLRLFVGRERMPRSFLLRFRRNSRETEEGALPSASAIFRMLRFFL